MKSCSRTAAEGRRGGPAAAASGAALLMWYLVLPLHLVPTLLLGAPLGVGAQSPAGAGKQNQGGGLVGEIFGAGAPGDGGKNGMDHAWDGQTDTWFDCLGPPDDFWDGCYTGIKLATPTAIGQIRFREACIAGVASCLVVVGAD
jgi:hypothetical protein